MALAELHELQARGVQLVLARPKRYMRRYGQPLRLGEKIGMDNVLRLHPFGGRGDPAARCRFRAGGVIPGQTVAGSGRHLPHKIRAT